MPDDIRFKTYTDTLILAAQRAFLPDGRIDIWASMPPVAVMRTNPVKLNASPLADRAAADTFFNAVATDEGLIAFRKAETEQMHAAFADKMRLAEEKRRAALTSAQRAEEDQQREWSRQREAKAAAIAARVQAELDLENYKAAMEIAKEDLAELPRAVAITLEAGRYDLVSDGFLRHAYESRDYNDWGRRMSVGDEYFRRFPAAPGAARTYASTSSSSSSSDSYRSGPTYADPAPLYRMPDYQMESKMRYLSGQSSSYMCGSSSFCN